MIQYGQIIETRCAMLKLSVIIPIYNVQEYLPACLDSVLDPKAEDYEIIAVVHGSLRSDRG